MNAGLLGAALLAASTLMTASIGTFSTTAWAQGATAQPAPDAAKDELARPMAACRADAATLCKDTPQGRGERVQCLLSNRDKTSPDCQAALQKVEERRAARKAQRDACRGDVKSLCATVEKGYAARVGCLKENEAKLSPTCKAALAQSPSPTAAQ